MGKILWQNNYGSDKTEYLSKIVFSHDGNSLMGYGYTHAFNVRWPWLLNVDTNGILNWHMTIKDPVNNSPTLGNIEACKLGYIVSGPLSNNKEKRDIGCFISLVDDNAVTKWSRLYVFDSLQFHKSDGYAIYHVDDSLGYGFGIAGDKILYFKIRLSNGDLLDVNNYSIKNNISPMIFHGALHDNELEFYMFLGGKISDFENYLILMKITTDGTLLWSKAYSSKEYNIDIFLGVSRPTLTRDKGIVFGQRNSIMSLLDSAGNVVFNNNYAYSNTFTPVKHVIQDDNGHYAAVSDILSHISPGRDIVFFKVDADGETLGCCTSKRNLETFFENIVEQNFEDINYSVSEYLPFEIINISTTPYEKLNEIDGCLNIAPIRRDTVKICVGDSVNINGIYYSTPQTIISKIRDTNRECDTLLITNIEYWKPEVGNEYFLNITCPESKEIYLEDNTQKAKVHYEYPSVASNCFCDDYEIKIAEGLASGEEFPLGITKNCYEVMDGCGNYSSCCFTVDVKFKDRPCDEKKIDCLSFHLLKVNIDSLGNRVFSCRVINECNSPIRYVYFELPKGMIAKAPANLSFYVGQSGREYRVRNPHFSPFYSISFQPSGQLFLPGDSDIFEYTLPPQADVQYFKAAVRLASGKYYEVHLNTFKCIKKYTEQYFIRSIHKDLQSEKVRVMPNPVRRNGVLYFNNYSGVKFNLYIQDITGRILYQRYSSEDIIDMSSIAISTGVYLYTIVFEDNTITRGKLLVVD
ncbi:MAG: HYR domain-containing protein [Cytophagaceae bacterium]|nr:HYR domain-containing protein [Cytophagaceae bacterium]MDW8457380.1 HYR domain-containing protein [Cytophagaceae bacterium]